MIKGVNRTIIEVNDPGSIYFEKAVFYLRPGVRQLPLELAQREADRCFYRAEGYRRQRRKDRLGRLMIYLGLIAVAAALLITLV